jgi:predicted O-methyltransferase YrrM
MSLGYLENLVREAAAAGRSFDFGCDEVELDYLAKLASHPEIRIIGETGFNAGFSSYAFLCASPGSHVYSFDLAEFDYTASAKKYIDDNFTGRHALVRGDSRQTVPEFSRENPGLRFDLIFIDGGHTYEVARADLRNMRAMATRETILVVDDIMPWKLCGVGPTRAWLEAVREGLVIQEELIKEGLPVTAIEPPGNRLWVVGRYNM